MTLRVKEGFDVEARDRVISRKREGDRCGVMVWLTYEESRGSRDRWHVNR